MFNSDYTDEIHRWINGIDRKPSSSQISTHTLIPQSSQLLFSTSVSSSSSSLPSLLPSTSSSSSSFSLPDERGRSDCSQLVRVYMCMKVVIEYPTK